MHCSAVMLALQQHHRLCYDEYAHLHANLGKRPCQLLLQESDFSLITSKKVLYIMQVGYEEAILPCHSNLHANVCCTDRSRTVVQELLLTVHIRVAVFLSVSISFEWRLDWHVSQASYGSGLVQV